MAFHGTVIPLYPSERDSEPSAALMVGVGGVKSKLACGNVSKKAVGEVVLAGKGLFEACPVPETPEGMAPTCKVLLAIA